MFRLGKTHALLVVRSLLKAVARFCLRHSLRIQDVVDSTKRVLIEAAVEQLNEQGEAVRTSRITVMTGIHRRDIERLTHDASPPESARDLISKVLGQWQHSKSFTTGAGKPRVLSVSPQGEFAKLVQSVSRELNPASILFELQRIGAISIGERGAKLVLETYSPRGDVGAGLEVLGENAQDETEAVIENLFLDTEPPHFHVRTSYDRIREDSVPEIKRWLLLEGHKFHASVREYLSSFDQDITPHADYAGGFSRVTLSSFSLSSNQEKPVRKT